MEAAVAVVAAEEAGAAEMGLEVAPLAARTALRMAAKGALRAQARAPIREPSAQRPQGPPAPRRQWVRRDPVLVESIELCRWFPPWRRWLSSWKSRERVRGEWLG